MDDAFKKSWAQAQQDGTTVAAAGAWISNQKFGIRPGIAVRTRAVIALGKIKYETTYRGALGRQAVWQDTVRQAFKRVDFIALPTLQSLPPRLPLFGGTVAFESRMLSVQNTAAVNLAGVPALAMPVPVRAGSVPVTSLQLVGPRRSEAALLNAGRIVEQAVRNLPAQ